MQVVETMVCKGDVSGVLWHSIAYSPCFCGTRSRVDSRRRVALPKRSEFTKTQTSRLARFCGDGTTRYSSDNAPTFRLVLHCTCQHTNEPKMHFTLNSPKHIPSADRCLHTMFRLVAHVSQVLHCPAIRFTLQGVRV